MIGLASERARPPVRLDCPIPDFVTVQPRDIVVGNRSASLFSESRSKGTRVCEEFRRHNSSVKGASLNGPDFRTNRGARPPWNRLAVERIQKCCDQRTPESLCRQLLTSGKPFANVFALSR
jgi:hypothetical protein